MIQDQTAPKEHRSARRIVFPSPTGSGGHRTNVDGGGRSGNDGATGAALHSVRSSVGPGYEVVLGAVDRPSFGAPTGGTRGVQHRRWESWVAGDPSTSRSGARTFTGSPAASSMEFEINYQPGSCQV
jgi:hypothetical protein